MMTTEQKIGAFFVVALVLFFLAVELTLGLGLLRDRYTVEATFRDVQGLDVGAEVRVAGIKAGRVESVELEERHVRVRMALDRAVRVKKDSVARLDFRALSGERFVALSLGTPTAPDAQPGDSLEGETPASFADVIDQMATVAESVTDLTETLGANSERLLTSLADVVEENRTALGAAAHSFASITGKIDQGTGTLGLLVNDPTLYDRATATLDGVQQSVQDIGRLTSSLADGRGTLGKLVTQDDGLYEQMRDTVDSLQATARNAREITDGLRAGEGTIGRALTDDSLYSEAQDTVRGANRALQAVEDQAPLSVLGTLVTTLF
jgi:phospholipid/cholesterol/gamma-HCH transport system substrate-binding protein